MSERRTVLLLTANEPLAERVRGLLEADGPYRLLVLDDASEGLHVVDREPVEMVLYDAELALEQGPAPAARLRSAHPFLPLIPVTRILRDGLPPPSEPYAPPDRTGCGGAPVDEPL